MLPGGVNSVEAKGRLFINATKSKVKVVGTQISWQRYENTDFDRLLCSMMT